MNNDLVQTLPMEREKHSQYRSLTSDAFECLSTKKRKAIDFLPLEVTSSSREYALTLCDRPINQKPRSKLLFKCKFFAKENVLGNGVTNIRSYLSRKHPNIDLCFKFNRNCDTDGNAPKQQKTMARFISETRETVKYKPQSEYQKQNNRLCSEYVALDLVPSSTVEHRGFQNIVSNAANKINSISRHTLGRELKIIEKEVDETLFTSLKEAYSIGTNTDVWTSEFGEW